MRIKIERFQLVLKFFFFKLIFLFQAVGIIKLDLLYGLYLEGSRSGWSHVVGWLDEA